MAAALAPLIVSGLGALNVTVSAATAATIASVGLWAGTTALSYFITKAMTPEPKTGTKLKFAFGEDTPQSIILGWAETAGSLVYVGSWGNDNANLVQVFAVCDMPVTDLDNRIWIDGEKASIDFGATPLAQGYPVPKKRKGGKDYMWVKFHDGNQTNADSYLVNKFSGLAQNPWTSDHVGRGRAYVIVTTKYNKKEPTGVPQCRFVVKGIGLYDWTKDSTNGGTGSHVYANDNTREWSQNAGVIAYNVARGIIYNGEWMYGGRKWPAYLLDNSSFTAARATSNDNIPLKAGGTQNRYTLGGEFSLDNPVFDTLDEIKAGCNGRMCSSGGVLYFDCGDFGAPEFTFTDAELFVNEAVEATIQPTVSGMLNTIASSYTEPDVGGNPKAINPKTNTAYVAADDGQILKATPYFRLIRDNKQCQRVSRFALNDNRRTLTRQVVMGPERRDGMRPGLVIAWTSSRYQYTAKQWAVGDFVMFRNGSMLVELREIAANDNAWTPASDEDDFTPPAWDRIVPTAIIKPVTVAAFGIKNNAGANKRPGLKVSWVYDEEVDIAADFMTIQVRLLDTTEIVTTKTVKVEQGFAIISDGILKNEAYQISALMVPLGDWLETLPTDWDDVSVYPAAADHVVAGNYGTDVDETAPAALPTPTMTLTTRRNRDGKIIQKLRVTVDLTGRPATETYRVRLADSTDSLTDMFPTAEFPLPMDVITGHTYTVRVLPVSRFGVVGPLSAVATGVTMPIPKKSTADGAVPAVGTVDIAAQHRRIILDWPTVDRSVYPDFLYSEVERSDNGTTGWAVVKNLRASGWIDGSRGNKETKHYRVRHFDSSDNPGTYSTPVSVETPRVGINDLDNDSIDTAKIRRHDLVQTTKMKASFKDKKTNRGSWTKDNVLKSVLRIANPTGGTIDVKFVRFSVSLSSFGENRDGEKTYALASLFLVWGAGSSKQHYLGKVKTGKKSFAVQKRWRPVTIDAGKDVEITVKLVYSVDMPVGLTTGKMSVGVTGEVQAVSYLV